MARKTKTPTLVSVSHLCEFAVAFDQQILRVHLNKYSSDEQAQLIEFRGPNAVAIANEFLPKMGFKKVRITKNILNPTAREIVIDYDTPLACDPGSETYHSM